MTKKHASMPVDPDEERKSAAAYDTWFREQVQVGLDDAAAGRLVSSEEVEAEAAAWRAETRLKLNV